MVKDSVFEYDEPWRETETFLRLLPGPRFARPPIDENGVVIRHNSTTISARVQREPESCGTTTRADVAAVPHPLEWGRRGGS